MPKKKRADVPAIRPQLDVLSDSVGDVADDPFGTHYPPVRRGPAWEFAVIKAAVKRLDEEDAGEQKPHA